MDPIQHPSNNKVLGAPKGWDQGGLPCSALAVTTFTHAGFDGLASFWKPSAQELAELNAGGTVMLTVFGQGMPPVSVATAPPF